MQRPDLLSATVCALCAQEGPVALVGIGGAGKSTLAAQACGDQRVRRAFQDGITWLEAGPAQDPVALLAGLARRLGLPDAAGFATAGQGRDVLAAALQGRRMLLAVDNVWDRGPLDALTGLADTCTVLFTTRLPDLATTVSATLIPVNEMTQAQALALLGAWTARAPAVSSDEARMLCTRVGNLALGVAMAGAMVARGRSVTDVLGLIELDLTRVRADLDPVYPYRTLLAAIEASITDLPQASQKRYEQLAVFAGRGPFPRDAAAALWQPELPGAEVGDLLAELTGRSLLAAASEGRYVAHDLQYDVLVRRLGSAGLAAAHARLLEGYRARYPGGWAGSAADPYLARALTGHLRDAGLNDELRAVLTDTAWIQARLSYGQMADLIPNYSHADEPLTRQVLRALRLSAVALTADPGQVRGQLTGRLSGHPDPAVDAWARDLASHPGNGAWLAPLTPALTPTTDPLQQTLTGHDVFGPVWSVAVTADGKTAVSGGQEGSVRVWDLAAGRQQAAFTGQADVVWSVAVTADGNTAVSGGRDRTVEVWDLAAGRQQAALTGHTDWVRSVAVTADGKTAVSGSDDGTVRVWDLAAGQAAARRSPATTARCWRWRSARTGRRRSAAAVTARCGCGTWPLGQSRRRSPATTARCCRWRSAADGRTAVSGSGDGTVRVWDLVAGKPSRRRLPATTARCGRWRSAPTGRRRSAETGRQWAATATGKGRCGSGTWPPDGSKPPSSATPAWCGRWRSAADGRTAVSGSDRDGTVRVWDLAAGRQQAALSGQADRVRVSGGHRRREDSGQRRREDNDQRQRRDGTVRVWDLAAGRATSRPHRPRRPGAGGGGHRGWADRRSAAARTARCGCGTWPPDRRASAALTGHAGSV